MFHSKKLLMPEVGKAFFTLTLLSLLLVACGSQGSSDTTSSNNSSSVATPTATSVISTNTPTTTSTSASNTPVAAQGCGGGGFAIARLLDKGSLSNAGALPAGATNEVTTSANGVNGNFVRTTDVGGFAFKPDHLKVTKAAKGIVYITNATTTAQTIVLQDTILKSAITVGSNGCEKYPTDTTLRITLASNTFQKVGVYNGFDLHAYPASSPTTKIQIDIPNPPDAYKD